MLNTAAVVLTAFGNVPVERASTLIEMLYGQRVSTGFVDRANVRPGRTALRRGVRAGDARGAVGRTGADRR